MSTADLRTDAGVKDRKAFTAALDELQAALLVIPSEVYYQPKFTYIWTLGVGRFPDALMRRVSRATALREIARCFLAGAAMTFPGELARVTGLSRPDAGLGNRALVAEGYAVSPATASITWRNAARCRRRGWIRAKSREAHSSRCRGRRPGGQALMVALVDRSGTIRSIACHGRDPPD
jgi:hypothetical protein